MTEKQPPKAPKSWRGKAKVVPGMEHWGEMKPPVYPERKPGFGGWLVGILTAWKR